MAEAKKAVFETVPVDSVRPHPKNPRRGDVEAIKESIRANGFFGALVVQTATRHILVGNHRWRAAKELGIESVPVLWTSVSDDEALRILLVDNRTSDLANWDLPDLAELLQAVPLEGTGYHAIDVKDLLQTLAGPKAPDEFADPEQDAVFEHECPRCGYKW